MTTCPDQKRPCIDKERVLEPPVESIDSNIADPSAQDGARLQSPGVGGEQEQCM